MGGDRDSKPKSLPQEARCSSSTHGCPPVRTIECHGLGPGSRHLRMMGSAFKLENDGDPAKTAICCDGPNAGSSNSRQESVSISPTAGFGIP
jgi:hypothetical protein